MFGESNGNWNGEEATDHSVEDRGRAEARRRYPLDGAECETPECKRPAVDRHHRDGDVTNNERSNVALLCRSCHKKEHCA